MELLNNCERMWVHIFILVLTLLSTAKSTGDLKPSELRFISEPADTLLRDTATWIHCHASSHNNKPVVRWLKNGVPISGLSVLGNGTLVLRGTQGDDGVYQCTVTVPGLGTLLSREAKIVYKGSPVFMREPARLTVFPGQTALFPCLVDSSSKVTWYKDDRQLSFGDRFTLLPSGSLQITDVRFDDKAFYRCEVSGLRSRSGELRINQDIASKLIHSPPLFISQDTSIKVLAGTEAFLECVANGNPQPTISWLKDGKDLEPGSRYTRIGSGSLSIPVVSLQDEGSYICRAENSQESVDSSIEVQVQVPPSLIQSPPKYVSAFEKDDILLECEATGHPEPEVKWYKNGDLIIESEYFQFVNGDSLKILGLVSSDAGVYQCLATNPVGSTHNHTILAIHSKADGSDSSGSTVPPSQHILGSGILSGVPGSPTNLKAVITSTRFMTLSWEPPDSLQSPEITGYSVFYRQQGSNRERVLNSTRGSLEEISIQGLQPGTGYTIRVLAHNNLGPGLSSPPLTVTTQPEVDLPTPPLHVTASPVSAFSILVSWDPPLGEHRITKYRLYYRRGEFSEDKFVEVEATMFHLSDLREFTEYIFWVSAFNSNGEGGYSAEMSCTTYSDIPADPPQNVTVEPASSSSIIVRWEPPPKESQNGILTGYKIKWRTAGSKNTQTVSTDGSRRLYAVTGLQKGRSYEVKMTALTVNGTGPFTSWQRIATFEADLDESVVPNPPAILRAKASYDAITIAWSPPESTSVLVRGYTIGWGKGIPDEYTKVVDNKQRFFLIENLKPNSEYVISLRAYNNVGDGRPIYETTRTKDEITREPSTPLVPPLGLHAIVLSSTTVVLTWVDSTLPRNQLISDNRYYIVRYTSVPSIKADRPKHNYKNATDLNAMIDDLRPNTEYEFTVKVVKGRRQSPWSLVALNVTQESAPASPPRDLNVMSNRADSTFVTLTWLPPRRSNGEINGYVVFYTDDKRKPDREWVVEGVVGDKTSMEIGPLNPNTKYYFKIHARNSKGYGPNSLTVSYRTRGAGSGGALISSGDRGATTDSGIPAEVQYAIFAAGGVIVIVAVIFGLVMCRRGNRAANEAVARDKPYMKGETGSERGKLNPPPPDLWINHDRLELKSMDSNPEDRDRSSLARSTPMDMEIRGSTSTIDRSRYIATSYTGTESELSYTGRDSQRRLLRQPTGIGNGKPVKIAGIGKQHKVSRYLSRESVASSIPSSIPAGGSCSGSTYIRSQYTLNPPPPASIRSMDSPHSPDPLPGYCQSSSGIGTATGSVHHCGEGSVGPPSTCNGDYNWGNTTASSVDNGSTVSCGGCNQGGPATSHHGHLPHYMSSAMSTSSVDSGSASGSGSRGYSGSGGSAAGSGGGGGLGSRRPSQLRSFNIPNPPVVGQTPFVRPTPTSPYKRSLLPSTQEGDHEGLCSSPSRGGGSNCAPMGEIRSPDMLHPKGPCDCLSTTVASSQSTEELNLEMRNLETVMKDLNAITGKPTPPHPLHISCPSN